MNLMKVQRLLHTATLVLAAACSHDAMPPKAGASRTNASASWKNRLIPTNTLRYSVRCDGREFLISEPGDEVESWGRATFAFFAIVNAQMGQSEYRFYALNGGNDLDGIFLTEAQARAARETISTKTDWPYLPDDEAPWYGQYH